MQIDHIDQLLPLIDGRKEFFVAERGRYKIIDYQILRPETFDHPGLLECRGIKFDADGNLLARPFQKFFNLGERPEGMPQDLDWSRPHRVLEKLDGTMIHPARLEGDIVFHDPDGNHPAGGNGPGICQSRAHCGAVADD